MSATPARTHGPIRRLAAVTAAFFAVLCLPGCGDDPPIRNVAVVVGLHVGAAGLLDGEGRAIPQLTAAVEHVLKGPGYLTIITTDGRPRAVKTIKLEYDGGSVVKRDDSYNANKQALENALPLARPLVAQADPTAALKLAGDTVRGKENPEILVFDNGLSTTGTVLMQLGLVDVGTDVAGLARQSKGVLLGSFADTTVHWNGLCSVTEPQPACSAGVQQQLQKYYEQLVTDAEGTIDFDDSPLAGGEPQPATAPPVDIVHWQHQRPTPGGPAPTPMPTEPPAVAVLTQDLVRFLPNSDEYADPDAAEKEIAILATRLRADGYRTAQVIGCTAKDPGSTEAQMKRRSISRAEKIAADLAAHGATTTFAVDGRGWHCPGYREGEHEANRRVIVIMSGQVR